jgi:hypothetical protein
MSDWRDEPINRHDTVTIRIIWVALFLSLLVHIAALWTSPPLVRTLAFEPSDKFEPSPALIAKLAPRASPPENAPPPPPPAPPSPPPRAAPPPARAAPTPPRSPPRPTTPPSPPPSPPPIARNETVPGPGPAPPPRPTPPVQAEPPRPPAVADLSAYIAARRNARGEAAASSSTSNAPDAPPAESEKERLNRIVAANLGLNTTPTFGDDPRRGGGLFQIRRLGYDDAEFYFNGWSQDIGRIARQLIEVRKGDNPDIRIAVIRKIIEIIRAHEPGDFIWVSRRMSRQVALSARPSDNAALEAFMMQEFFGGEPRQK